MGRRRSERIPTECVDPARGSSHWHVGIDNQGVVGPNPTRPSTGPAAATTGGVPAFQAVDHAHPSGATAG